MLLRGHHVGLRERDRGVAGGQPHDRVGDRQPVVRPVRPVGDAVVGGHELVGVVLALDRRRDAVVERRHDAAYREVLRQEALTERILRHRVAERGEAQLVRRRSRRVVGEPCLHVVEHHRTLRQADRGAATTVADRVDDIGDTDVDRFADAGSVHAQPREGTVQATDAREQPLQGVALHLSGGVVDDLAVQSGEPVRPGAHDVFVVRNAQHVCAAQRVRAARRAQRRRTVGRGGCRWQDRRFVGARDAETQAACRADGDQRSDRREQSAHLVPHPSRLHRTLPVRTGRAQASNRTNSSRR